MRTEFYKVHVARLLKAIACAGVVFLYAGCNDDVNVPDGAFDEKVVDLSGQWAIASVLQNGVDITDLLEFSRLDLQLNSNSEGPLDYSVENDGIPFLVTENGTWSFDDNIYPTEVTFNSNGESYSAAFVTPPVSGGTEFSIRFALGCADNSYTYLFTRQ